MRVKEGNKWKDIYEAAIKIFAEYGYFNAKIAKIAELAGVATGSVYLYFRNKEDLLSNIFNNLWKKMYDNSVYLRDNKELAPSEKLDQMLDTIFDIYTEHPNLAILVINEHGTYLSLNRNQNPKYYDEFFLTATEIYNEGVRNNVFTPDINVELFKNIIIGSFRELLHHWALSKKTIKLEEIRKTYKYVMKYGIMKHK
ncbi:MAG TPA: TetR/AcrR family transcriptional regulator [Ignavibacteria bacterium]|nr:TetR/AcrR family transcriptional regulator [Ignavibacteria bacterium]